jgi:chitinase
MKKFIPFLILLFIATTLIAQSKKELDIIAYYSAGPERVDSLPAEKLTHIIFSFCHLKGNKLAIDNAQDTLTIQKLVGLKKRNPQLKVLLSLGGWGGCETCSDVFSEKKARKEFAKSVLALNKSFNCDGLDLDWEYPTVRGYPGHAFKPEDKPNFTALVSVLRKTLGSNYELSFASGGTQRCLEGSVDWSAITKNLDRINIMSYDLVGGGSATTGHHTALYSNTSQINSTDYAVQYLLKAGVPGSKIVIGAAFYARVWENVEAEKNGLYQPGKFKRTVNYRRFPTVLKGFQHFWDETSQAPYAYDASNKLFATFDDKKSLALKTQYAIDQQLGGIMFWELSHDTYEDGLVDAIYKVKAGQ